MPTPNWTDTQKRVLTKASLSFNVNEDDRLHMGARFVEDLEADELDLIEFVMALEGEFDVVIDDEVAAGWKNLGDAVRFIEKMVAA